MKTDHLCQQSNVFLAVQQHRALVCINAIVASHSRTRDWQCSAAHLGLDMALQTTLAELVHAGADTVHGHCGVILYTDVACMLLVICVNKWNMGGFSFFVLAV